MPRRLSFVKMRNSKHKISTTPISYREYFIFTYIIVASLFSILLFLYGFFPVNYNESITATNRDIPQFVERTRLKVDEVYKPVVKKIVIMVIDALRWDFVTGINGSIAMPNVNSLLKSSAGCAYKTRVSSPTVTMPRIKAMTTGTVPNFIDIVLNLGAKELSGDSIMRQMKNRGHNLVFYGDDTWLKLFPNMFHRSEGVTSFYVTDFTEVDNNVTRNVEIELNKKDWSVLILHYLGLDHIGHVAGPFSPLINVKLHEMDDIIGRIESHVSEWNKNDEPTLFLICGDHGMKDSGGHGGATPEETLVPLIAFGRSCKDRKEEVAQIDIASTLSILLGLPIPSTNLGTIIMELISDLPYSQKLFVLYYNAKQLVLRYQKIGGYQFSKAYKNYQNAIKLHSAWLNTNSHPNEMVPDIILMYESAIVEMKNTLSNSLLKYDVGAMTLATVLLGHILYICISKEKSPIISVSKFFIVLFISYGIWLILNQLFDSEMKTILFPQTLDFNYFLVIVPIFGILLVNCYLCATHNIVKFNELLSEEKLLSIGTFVHAISLASSSFVEEEHQTWYFYWITLMICFAYDILRKSSKQRSLKLCTSLFLIMICHRILRRLNSTGDKYAHLPDISGWLQDQKTNFGMTVVLGISLILLVWIDFIYEQIKTRIITFFFDISIAILIYLRHAAAHTVYKPNIYISSKGIEEIHLFWIFLSLYLLHSIYRLTKAVHQNKLKVLTLTLFLMLKKWVILASLLHRPYNVILLPIQLMAGVTIYNLTKNLKDSNIKMYLHLWSSNAFYFYQGNSNSLATIDLAAGYVGLKSYQPVITGIFLSINTYSAPILGFLMYLCDYAGFNPSVTSKNMLAMCKQYAFWRLMPMTFYSIVTNLQRYHLFVWTVFSPKLLYEAMHCTVLFSVMLLLQLNFLLNDKINVQKHFIK